MAELGTIEKDACSHFGKHDKKLFQGYSILENFINKIEFKTVLDVGAGECLQSKYFEQNNKLVSTCDFPNIDGAHCTSKIKYDYPGNFLDLDFAGKQFDFVFSSHALEHQRNAGKFIDKMISVTKEGGYLCIVVPIRKPFITGGHMSIWNSGLLLYNIVASGVDCSKSYIHQLDYDICVVVQLKKVNVNNLNLTYDRGDVDLLKKYFPFNLKEPFNGDVMYHNTLFEENK
tara:strand:- start:2962 stop:3651 length:690 start_codon:yes stop_codon:yes gene_type:complete